ncbi:MAG: NADH-quinone oxidoreductase subunit H [Acidimicrobiia bacterium]|nr:NADH-quinone oxidoreductase subunit H [Acidimicrobiia bacterium]
MTQSLLRPSSSRTGNRPSSRSSSVVAALLPLTAGVVGYVYLFKMMSFMQSRLGPMEAGPFGSLQLLAEVGKWLQKEDIVPERRRPVRLRHRARRRAGVDVPASYVVIPAGPDAGGRRTSTSASSSPWPCRRCRSSASSWPAGRRPTSTPCSAACAPPASSSPTSCRWCSPWSAWSIAGGHARTSRSIVAAQADGEIFGWDGIGNPFILTQIVGFTIFLIAVQAELTQSPFDMPIAESELVAGYQVEYSGFRFLMFFIAEFATAGALIASVLFLGGWWTCRARRARSTASMHVARPASSLLAKIMLLVVPDLLGPLHASPLPRGPAPGVRVEVPDPPRARQHRRHRRPARWCSDAKRAR